METKEFKGTPTEIDVAEALARVEYSTVIKEQLAKEAGMTAREYEEENGKREITLGDAGAPKDVQEKYESLINWVFESVPKELHDTKLDVHNKIIRIFQKEAEGPSFLDIWNWKINLPSKLVDKVLINASVKKMEYLRDANGIDLDLSGFIEVKNKQELIKKVEKLIEGLKENLNKIPILEVPDLSDNISKSLYSMVALNYLIQKIVIKKLEEIYGML